MKQPKKGGGTLREYRVLHWRITVETYSERTAKQWQVTVFRQMTIAEISAVLRGENGGDVPRLAKAGERVGGGYRRRAPSLSGNHTAGEEADSLEPSGGNVSSAPAPTPLTESDS